jgi:hypothetical protein
LLHPAARGSINVCLRLVRPQSSGGMHSCEFCLSCLTAASRHAKHRPSTKQVSTIAVVPCAWRDMRGKRVRVLAHQTHDRGICTLFCKQRTEWPRRVWRAIRSADADGELLSQLCIATSRSLPRWGACPEDDAVVARTAGCSVVRWIRCQAHGC